MSTQTKAHNELAQFIADGILATCETDVAYRIALKQGNPTSEKDLGGLCRDALVNRIEALLNSRQINRSKA